MNILFVCKFFPIQGGEATKAYWLTKALASFGHKIIIITDTSHYNNEQLCILSPNDKMFLSGITLIDNKNTGMTLENTIKETCLHYNIQIIVGWYLFPYALTAIHTGLSLNIPVVIQHAGSDIKKLLNMPQEEKKHIVQIINRANFMLSYPNTENLLKEIGIKKIQINTPVIPIQYFKKTKYNNGRFLILGAKNKSKNYNNIKENSIFHKISIDWFGIGETFKNEYFNSYQSIAPWNIPDLISQYKGIIYSENNFNVSIHESRIPLEVMAGNKVVFMDNETAKHYLYDNIISFNDFGKLKNIETKSFFIDECDDSIWYEDFEYRLLKTKTNA
jgi:hypothetical protein